MIKHATTLWMSMAAMALVGACSSGPEDPTALAGAGAGAQGPSAAPGQVLPGAGDRSSDPAAIPQEALPSRLIPELELLPQIAGGQAFFTDPLVLQPGEDVTYCTFVDGTTDTVSYIHNSLGSQSQYGHHILMYYASKPEEPGTRPCGGMEKYTQTIGGSAGESGIQGGEDGIAKEYPGSVVSEVPAGVQFVINHHWINSGSEAAEVQGMMMSVPPPTTESLQVARVLSVVNTEFKLLPGQTTQAVAECVMEQDVPVFMVAGHQHEWGTWVKGERVSQDGTAEILFDHAWNAELAVNPKLFFHPVDYPLMLHAGDTVRITCDWMNTTASTIGFPREMCVLPAYTLAEKEVTCLNGKWLAK